MRIFTKNHIRKPRTIELVKYRGYNGSYARDLQTMYIARRVNVNGKTTDLVDWMSEGFGSINLKYAEQNAARESLAIGWPIICVDET